jgi:glycopeptide antibiotics resistance protein
MRLNCCSASEQLVEFLRQLALILYFVVGVWVAVLPFTVTGERARRHSAPPHKGVAPFRIDVCVSLLTRAASLFFQILFNA